jgi:hypothetical protein
MTAKCWENPRGQCFGIADGPDPMTDIAKPEKKFKRLETLGKYEINFTYMSKGDLIIFINWITLSVLNCSS